MASYFNLTLDTLAPSGVSVKINDGATYTTSTTVSLKIALSDSQTSGYQMKVWGTADAATEDKASWQTFAETKQVVLPSGDGLKTVYVKVRDDVGNESTAASDSITLDTAVAAVTITGPDRSKISKVSGFDAAAFAFTSDRPFVEYKVCVVPATNSLQDAGTVIPTTNGSSNTSGTGSYNANTAVNVTIKAADLEKASSGDGVKIIKIFVRSEAGIWSVA